MKPTPILAIATALAMLSAAPALAQSQDRQAKDRSVPTPMSSKKDSSRDAKRLKDLALANMAEIETGKLALEKAQDPKVKEFAQHMVDDHGKMLEEVKQLAQAKGVELPTTPDARHRKALKKLQSLSGEKFDREYMQAMVKDHRDALKLARGTAKSAKDAELKAAAQKAAPDIQEHLKMAQDISRTATAKGEKRSAAGR